MKEKQMEREELEERMKQVEKEHEKDS